MVYGRTGAKTVIALICPKKFAIEVIAKEKGITGAFDELCKHEVVVEAVAKSCLQACKEGKPLGFEIPSAIVLCATPTENLPEPRRTPAHHHVEAQATGHRQSVRGGYHRCLQEIWAAMRKL